MKNFDAWNDHKKKTDQKDKRLRFREREVWSVCFGVNVGFELDGSGNAESLRSCLVIKKLSNETFYALPLTSKLKNGSWYHPSVIKGIEGRYVLGQMKLLDAKRLKYLVETIPEKEFLRVKQGFVEFFTT